MNRSVPIPEVWVEEFKVHSYEVDFRHMATLETLCRYLQEAAWNHAELLGVGFGKLEEQGRVWVLSRFTLRLDCLPRWNDAVVVHTWPRRERSVFAMRDFEVLTQAGSRLAAASSAWLMLESATRKPLRADKYLANIAALSDRRALPEDPPKLASLPPGGVVSSVHVRYSDIDVNHHVNNSRYVGWLLDSYPMEFHACNKPVLLDVNFLGETKGGENLSVISLENGPGEVWHSVRSISDQEEICRAKIRWHQNSEATD